MMALFKTRTGLLAIAAFLGLMAIVTRHVVAARRQRETPKLALAAQAPPRGVAAEVPAVAPNPPAAGTAAASLAENAAYLSQFYALDKRAREDRDAQGVPLTRRETPKFDRFNAAQGDDGAPNGTAPVRATSRLIGHAAPVRSVAFAPANVALPAPPVGRGLTPSEVRPPPPRPRNRRFNPYGSVVKCELVFTLDSANEETPLIGVVMEPVYNNGALVIPAGAELHGVARPDRLRDRLVSGADWVLVFPRERGLPNGRQLNVRGVALDRVEPDANGMTWGLTDGSFGLEGKVIRTMALEEIKRFVATFLAASTEALQQRQSVGRDRDTIKSTPQNAVLQGLSANFAQVAADISAEIETHGVFIRVPAGHQFYFYPMQLIDADVADVSADIATVK